MKKNSHRKLFFLTGILLIIFGILLIIFRQLFVTIVMQVIAVVIVGASLLHFIRNLPQLSKKESSQEASLVSLQGIISLTLSIWILFDDTLSIELFSWVLGSYLILISIISLVSAYIMFMNDIPTKYSRLFFAILHFILGILSFYLPVNRGLSLIGVGLYSISLGLTYIFDATDYNRDFDDDSHNRRPRAALPVIFRALYPFQSMNKIKEFIAKQPDNQLIYQQAQPVAPHTLTIIVTTNSSDFDKFGHIGFAYRDKVYDYGNHDHPSRYLFDSIGDGVVAIVQRQPYIDFLMNKGSALIEYDVPLDEEQDAIIANKVRELMANTEKWRVPTEQKNSYSWRLMTQLNAEFRKFIKGRYKNYFVFGSNCVLITDEVIGSLGVDVFNWVPFLSPGTYLDFLEKEYNKENSWISQRRINLKWEN